MDRATVYFDQTPLETDVLRTNQYAMVGLAKLSEAVLGTGVAVSGFPIAPTAPASLSVTLGAGQVYQQENLEASSWSSLPADTHTIVKQGILLDAAGLTFTAPTTPGYSQCFLIEVQYQDVDTLPVVLPYYNAANPDVTLNGPAGNNAAQNTARKGAVAYQIKAGISATSGTQVAPAPDAGWAGLYVVTLAYGATTVTAGNIALYSGAPFLPVTLPGVPLGVQSGQWRFGTDSGTASSLVIALNPTPAALTIGMEVIVRVAAAPTGTTVANVASLGNLPVVRRGNAAIASGDWAANDFLVLRYTGSSWKVAGLLPSDILAITKILFASQTYFVNASTGNDANTGLTATTAFATIQAAVNKIAGFNLNGFSVAINVADGTYAPVSLPATSGSGSVNLVGNTASPANVSVVAPSGPCFAGSGTYTFNGFKVTSNADTPGVPGSGDGFQAAGSGTQWALQNIAFGPCATAHIASDQARVTLSGAIRIGGGGKAHMLASNGGSILAAANNLPALTISAACSFTTGFATVNNVGIIQTTYSSITGAASVTSSVRFSATTNGIIQTSGSGANYYPGDTAGVQNTGGQYA